MPVLLDIADVAVRSGLAPSALRFYEKRGLIAPAGRNGLRAFRQRDHSLIQRHPFSVAAPFAGAVRARVDLRQLRTEEENERRVVDPEEQHDEPASGSPRTAVRRRPFSASCTTRSK